MSQRVGTPASKPDDLGLTLRAHMKRTDSRTDLHVPKSRVVFSYQNSPPQSSQEAKAGHYSGIVQLLAERVSTVPALS